MSNHSATWSSTTSKELSQSSTTYGVDFFSRLLKPAVHLLHPFMATLGILPALKSYVIIDELWNRERSSLKDIEGVIEFFLRVNIYPYNFANSHHTGRLLQTVFLLWVDRVSNGRKRGSPHTPRTHWDNRTLTSRTTSGGGRFLVRSEEWIKRKASSTLWDITWELLHHTEFNLTRIYRAERKTLLSIRETTSSVLWK